MAYLTCEDADKILETSVPWETYTTARLITEKDLALIRRYDKRSEEMRSSMLDEVQSLLLGPHVDHQMQLSALGRL